jgi:hypothetical protein
LAQAVPPPGGSKGRRPFEGSGLRPRNAIRVDKPLEQLSWFQDRSRDQWCGHFCFLALSRSPGPAKRSPKLRAIFQLQRFRNGQVKSTTALSGPASTLRSTTVLSPPEIALIRVRGRQGLAAGVILPVRLVMARSWSGTCARGEAVGTLVSAVRPILFLNERQPPEFVPAVRAGRPRRKSLIRSH